VDGLLVGIGVGNRVESSVGEWLGDLDGLDVGGEFLGINRANILKLICVLVLVSFILSHIHAELTLDILSNLCVWGNGLVTSMAMWAANSLE
jgi:hypothetical protein